jgi:signal transduction histidine kinase
VATSRTLRLPAFAVRRRRRPERGVGLHGLHQSVGSVGGTLTIVSPPGGPTSIKVTLS